MKIALIEYYDEPTPLYRVLAAELRKRGHRVWLGASDREGNLRWHDGLREVAVLRGPRQATPPLPVPRLRGALARLFFLGFMLRLRGFLQQHELDIVQVNLAGLHWLWVLPLFRPRPMRYILDFCQIGQLPVTNRAQALKNWGRNLAYQLLSRCSFDHTCFSREAGARKILGPSWARWATAIPVGVDPAFLALPHPAAPAAAPAEGPVRFVYIGTISQVRKLERLILAARQARRIAPAFRVDFIGPDLSHNYYQNLASDLGVDDIISFAPPIPYEAIPATVLGYDVGLAYVPESPVDWQYYPTMKVLEYRALGIPILASDNPPNRMVVEDGVNGVVVENTVDGLALGLLRFVADPSFRRGCRERARAMRCGDRWSEVAERYEQLYQRLTGPAPRPRPAGRAALRKL